MTSSVENKRDAELAARAAGPDSKREAFAPGLRVEIRDAEWVVKRADLTSNGTHSVLVSYAHNPSFNLGDTAFLGSQARIEEAPE
jgi:hypothetical protein